MKRGEYARFDSAMRKLMAIPHSAVKAKLDAEKRAKKKRKPRASASGRASAGKD